MAFTPLTKIFKNRTGSSIVVAGVQLSSNEDFVLPKSQWAKMADEYQTWSERIFNGTVIINDGTVDLPPNDAIDFLQILAVGATSSTGGSFPRRKIKASETVTVNDEEMWTIYQQMEIFNAGQLILDGEVAIIT